MKPMKRFFCVAMSLIVTLSVVSHVSAQWTALERGSENISVEGHLPLGPRLSVADIELEQEMSRPFAYIGRIKLEEAGAMGMDIIDLSDPTDPRVLLRWRIEDEDFRLFRYSGLDRFGLQFEAGIGAHRHALPAEDIDEVFVHDEIGVGEEDFVAWIDRGQEGEKQTAGDTGRNRHVV